MGFPQTNVGENVIALDALKKRSDFLRLRSGKKFHSRFFTLQAKRSPHTGTRYGLTVTTKVGNAVVRNRIKRRLRQAALEVLPVHGKPEYDYVLIAREAALSADFRSLLDEFARGLDHMHTNGANGSKTGH